MEFRFRLELLKSCFFFLFGIASFAVAAKDAVLSHPQIVQKFSSCESIKNRIYLDDKLKYELKKIESGVDSTFYTRYEFLCGGVKKKYYLISNIVRTHYQAVLVEVNDKQVGDYLVLAFNEPNEYHPQPSWLERLKGTLLLESNNLNKRPDALSGATLTHQATIGAMKIALGLEKTTLKN